MARSFNGSTDRISLGSPGTWNPGTIAFRFKHTSTSVMVLASIVQNNARRGFSILANPFSVGRIYVECYPGSTPTAVGIASSGTPAMNDGNWHHCAFNFNQNNGQSNELFLDGTSVGAANASADWGWTHSGDISENIDIAKDPGGFYANYTGSLADYALWTGVQLTADEIAALAKGVPPNRIRPTSLEIHMPMVRDVRDLRGRAVSVTGGTVVDHPRLDGGAV
jgi:hypothetical protein